MTQEQVPSVPGQGEAPVAPIGYDVDNTPDTGADPIEASDHPAADAGVDQVEAAGQGTGFSEIAVHPAPSEPLESAYQAAAAEPTMQNLDTGTVAGANPVMDALTDKLILDSTPDAELSSAEFSPQLRAKIEKFRSDLELSQTNMNANFEELRVQLDAIIAFTLQENPSPVAVGQPSIIASEGAHPMQDFPTTSETTAPVEASVQV